MNIKNLVLKAKSGWMQLKTGAEFTARAEWYGIKSARKWMENKFLAPLEQHGLMVSHEAALADSTLADKYTALLQQVETLAAKAGIKPPKVRVTKILAYNTVSEETLLIGEDVIKNASPGFFDGWLAHEYGHIKRGDLKKIFRPLNHKSEYGADAFAVDLLGTYEPVVEAINHTPDPSWGSGVSGLLNKRIYPSNVSRIEHAQKTPSASFAADIAAQAAEKDPPQL